MPDSRNCGGLGRSGVIRRRLIYREPAAVRVGMGARSGKELIRVYGSQAQLS